MSSMCSVVRLSMFSVDVCTRLAFSRSVLFFFSSRRRHTRLVSDWSSDVCSSDLSSLGKPVDTVRIRNGLTVPAEADYVLEGRLTKETHDEGPFVDAVRTYDRVRKEPILVVERVYRRKDAVFHIIVGGLDEHFMFMGMPREPVIYQAVSRAVPHVQAVRLTEGGCAWLHGIVAVLKQHQGAGTYGMMDSIKTNHAMEKLYNVEV